jgi:hypothetical protein
MAKEMIRETSRGRREQACPHSSCDPTSEKHPQEKDGLQNETMWSSQSLT